MFRSLQKLIENWLDVRPSIRRRTSFASVAADIHQLERRLLLSATPAITAPAAVSVNQGTSIAFTGSNAIGFSDAAGTENFSFAVHHGQLNFGSTSGLNVSGNGSSVVLMSGTAAAINSAFATLSYTPNSNYSGSDSFGMYVLNSTSNLSTSAAISITVTPSSTIPAITAPAAVSVTQGNSIAFIGSNAIGFNDGAGTENFSFAVQHGKLNFGSTSGLNVSGNGSSVVLISGTAAAINSAFATLSYTPNTNYSGSDSFGMYVLNSATNQSTSAAISITVTPSNTRPTITAPSTVSVVQATLFAFTGGNTVGFSDGAGTENFSFAVQHGRVSVTSTNGLNISGNATSVMTMSGTASAVNAALATIAYIPDVAYSGPDTLSMYVLNSATNQSTSAAIAITVTPNVVLTPPSISAPLSVSTLQDTSLAFTGGNLISITDTSGTAEQVSLSVTHGNLGVSATAGVTIANNNTGSVTLTGTLTAVNSALATLQYTPTSAYNGPDTLNVVDKDTTNNLTSNLSISITITPDPPPTLSVFSVAHVSQNGTVTLNGTSEGTNGISISGGSSDQLILSVSHGALNVPASAGVTIANNNTGSVTLTGSASAITSALGLLQYSPTTDYIGPDTLSLSVKDTSTNFTANASISIIVTPPITGPTITAPSAISANHGTFAFSGSNAVTFYDTNTTGTENFSFAVQHGVLNFAPTNVSSISGNHSSVVLMTGTADQIFAILSTLSYTPDNGYSGPDSFGMYVVNSTTNQSTSADIAITVAPTNLAPSIIAPSRVLVRSNQAPFSEDDAIIFSDGPGTENFSFAVQDGQLNFGSTTGLVVSGNGSSVVLMSGTAAAISAALATLTYTPNPNFIGPDSFGMYVLNSSTNLSTSAAINIFVRPNTP